MLMNNNPYTKYHIECDECLSEYLIYHINAEEAELMPEHCSFCASIVVANRIEEDIEDISLEELVMGP